MEVIAAARLSRFESTLVQLEASSVAANLELDVTALLPAAIAARAERPGMAPWVQGRRLATLARKRLGLRLDPLSSVDLNNLLRIDATHAYTASAADAIGAGFRSAGSPERVLPVTDASTARQKAQRAFAQEFLCPIEGLRGVVSLPNPTSDEVTEAADRYAVSEWTVITALVNHRDISRAYLARMQQP